MAQTSYIPIVTFITLTTLFFIAVAAQGPTAAPSYAPGPAYVDASGPAPDECLMKLLNVSDCLSFVDVESNLTKPDEPCCGELAGLVESSPQCLCELLSTKQSMFNISVSRALQLPSVCHVTTPPPSLCSFYGIPVDVPASAPAPIAGEGATSVDNTGIVSPSGSPGNGASTSSLSVVASTLALGAVLLITMVS